MAKTDPAESAAPPSGRLVPMHVENQISVCRECTGKVVRTTVTDSSAPCPLDRVNRQFKADRPNQLWVSDFTNVLT
jgi:transposase InsO family protein